MVTRLTLQEQSKSISCMSFVCPATWHVLCPIQVRFDGNMPEACLGKITDLGPVGSNVSGFELSVPLSSCPSDPAAVLV